MGWRYRGTFPSLWDTKTVLDRNDVQENDTFAKLVSKQYADTHRGAKESNIAVGDKVVVAINQPTKTNPSFSNEKYTVLTRQGAKEVIRGDDVFSRNVQDVKRIPVAPERSKEETAGNDYTQNERNQVYSKVQDATTNDRDDGAPGLQSCDSNEASERVDDRPKRKIKKPAKLADMYLYNIFE